MTSTRTQQPASTLDQQPAGTVSLPPDLPGRAVDIVHAAARRAGHDISTISIGLHATRTLTAHLRHGTDRSERAGRAVLAQLGVLEGLAVEHAGNHSSLTADVPALGPDWTVTICVDPIRPVEPLTGDVDALVAQVDAARAAADQAAPATGEGGDDLTDRPGGQGRCEGTVDDTDADEDAFWEEYLYLQALADEDARAAADQAVPATGEGGEHRHDDPTHRHDQGRCEDQAPTTVAAAAAGSGGKACGGSSGSVQRAVRFWARFDSVCPACGEPLREGTPASWSDGEVVHDTCAEAAGIDVFDPR